MPTVLILGAGLSTAPLPKYLSEHGIHVIIGSRTLAKAQEMAHGLSNVECKEVDVTNESHRDLLVELIKSSEIVISMLPYLFHPTVAKLAIEHKKHFFTTSYVSDGIKALEEEAIANGVVLANELGVDPGMDHMSAMRIIDEAHAKGGKVLKFLSYCGALPAPDSNDNPLGYKFSWAPRGVLLAAQNGATYLKNGEVVEIKSGKLYDHLEFFDIDGVGTFEGYANRNSCDYIPIYNIPEVQTITRGTFRYSPWCNTIKDLQKIGYLNTEENPEYSTLTYKQLLARLINADVSGDIIQQTTEFLQTTVDSHTIETMKWLDLFGDELTTSKTALDALCGVMMSRMVFKEGQRDMILMQHLFHIEYETKREVVTSRLTCFGASLKDTSIAQTVSLPIAITVRLFLEGKMNLNPGIMRPVKPEIYNPVLDELESLGYKFEDSSVEVSSFE